MKNMGIGNRVIPLLAALLLFGFLLQGCGDDAPAVHPIEGKWAVSEKGTANDPKNEKVNRFILEFVIDLYKKNMEIKLVESPRGFIFSFDDILPVHYEIVEEKENLIVLKNLKDGQKIEINIDENGQIVFATRKIKHPLVPEPGSVVMHLIKKKKKK